MDTNISSEVRAKAAKELSKNERFLVLKYALALSKNKMSKNDLVEATSIPLMKINGDIYGLRSSSASNNIEIIHDDGKYFYLFTGDIDALEPLSENGKIALGLTAMPESSSLRSEAAPEADTSKKPTPSVEPSKSHVSADKKSTEHSTNDPANLSLRAKIANCLVESNGRLLTPEKISKAIKHDQNEIIAELKAMANAGLVEEQSIPDFEESVYKSNQLSSSVLKETVKADIPQNTRESTKETATKETVHESKITVAISKKIITVLKAFGKKEGAKGKISIVKAAHDSVKDTDKVPKHDVETFVELLIEQGDLVVAEEDGRGPRYMHKDVLVKKEPVKEIEHAVESTVPVAPSTPSSPVVAAKEPNDKAEEFDIHKMIAELQLSIEAEDSIIGPSLMKVFIAIAKRVEKTEEENKKWRQIYSAQVDAMKMVFGNS